MDRVSAALGTTMRSARRDSPDPVALVHQGVAVDAWTYRAKVLLDAPAGTVRQWVPATVGVVEEVDDRTSQLSIGADDVDWLARFLVGLPVVATVEEPAGLQTRLADLGEALVRHHCPEGTVPG